MIIRNAPSRPVVLQVLHSLQVGGAEILAARLARRLCDRYQFVFACLDGLGTLGQELRDEGFEVEVLGRKAGVDLGCVRRLARFAADRRASVIHAHQYTPFFYSRAPGWFGRRPPVLFTEHGRMYPDLPNRKRMMFNRLFLRRCDRVVAVGESVKKALVDNEGIPADRIQVIYNGVRLGDFSSDPAVRVQMRQQLGLGPNQPVAIQVARLDYLKDHCTAIRAAERIRAQLPDFQLLLVGEGPERAKIESEIATRGLRSTVRLLGLRKDVRELLCAADLFLLTSISEGIPVTIVEAMAAHVPVVSTSVGGIPEVIIDKNTGYLAPPADDNRIADRVLTCLRSQKSELHMVEAAAARAQSMFSEEQMHSRYNEVLQQMLTSSGHSAVLSIGTSES